jgi:S1-C subfamily serine protease
MIYWLQIVILISFCLASYAQENDVRRDAAVVAVEKVMPSVVNIATETVVYTRHPLEDLIREFYDPFYRRRTPNMLYSLGSGVIIDEDGYLITNEHVVRSATRIAVKLYDGREYECDRVVGSSRSDVALLKIRCKPGEKFVAAKFADDEDLLLGETVLALGNPFGLGGSVTKGILSSKNRRPPRENEPLDVADWLQTDAAINPGNSGGPLINLKGEVIGINVAVYREAQGIGFAIPIRLVSEALSETFTPENLKSLWFGAKVRAGAGAREVLAIEEGSPAQKAGLMKGDIITAVNGKPVNTYIGMMKEIVAVREDDSVAQLTVKRGGAKKVIAVKLIPERSFFNEKLIQARLGILVEELSDEFAAELGLGSQSGLIIRSVDKNSPAEKAGLTRGLIIRTIDEQPASSVLKAARLIYSKKKGESIVLKVLAHRRQGYLIEMRTFDVELKLE